VDRRRSREDRELVARSRPFARFQTPEAHETLVSGLLLSRRLRKHIELLTHYRRLGVRTLEEARDFEIARRKKEQTIKVKRSKQGAEGLLGASSASQSGDLGTKPGASSSGPRRGRAALADEASVEIAPSQRQITEDLETSGGHGAKINNTDAIRDAPDGDLLSVAEMELCFSLGLAPQQYLAIQAVVVRYSFAL
jgi:transcriptional adapter 2-alpha